MGGQVLHESPIGPAPMITTSYLDIRISLLSFEHFQLHVIIGHPGTRTNSHPVADLLPDVFRGFFPAFASGESIRFAHGQDIITPDSFILLNSDSIFHDLAFFPFLDFKRLVEARFSTALFNTYSRQLSRYFNPGR